MIIGVSGKIGAGKDAIATHLVEHHGFKIVRFSDPLKEEVLNIMRKTCVEIWKAHSYDYTPNFELREPTYVDLRKMIWDTKPPIIRRLLQEWGTELRRNEQPDYWIRKWKIAARECEEAGISIVTPDTRFLNEAEAVKELGGRVWCVVRPGLPDGDHASETEMNLIHPNDFILNNGTLEDLGNLLDDLL